MAGAVYIPMAKLMDVWGRAEGFLLMVGFAELGLILTANSDNLPTYCAAQVFYTVGYSGLIYAVEILAIDASDLRNRALAFAFTSSPYMITAFAGPAAAEAFLLKVSWQWGFGAFTIIMPFFTLPVYLLLKLNLNKAKKMGLLKPRVRSGRTLPQNIVHWFHEFDGTFEKSSFILISRKLGGNYTLSFDFVADHPHLTVIGVFLFAAGLVIFLLPFTIAALAPKGWATGYIIAMIVVGLFLIAVFAVWEIWLAPVPFLAARHLQNRTLLAVCLINTTYQMAYYCWNSYFTSFLQVVNGVTVAQAGYINNTFQVVSGVELFIVGYFIRRTGKLIIALPSPPYIDATQERTLGLMGITANRKIQVDFLPSYSPLHLRPRPHDLLPPPGLQRRLPHHVRDLHLDGRRRLHPRLPDRLPGRRRAPVRGPDHLHGLCLRHCRRRHRFHHLGCNLDKHLPAGPGPVPARGRKGERHSHLLGPGDTALVPRGLGGARGDPGRVWLCPDEDVGCGYGHHGLVFHLGAAGGELGRQEQEADQGNGALSLLILRHTSDNFMSVVEVVRVEMN